MEPGPTTDFGIGVLADRTGLSPQVLRAWERRLGLEIGSRSASGHRRFTEEDVEVVRDILRGRDQGLTLAVAIQGATGRRRGPERTSVHAALVDQHPELPRLRLDHRDLRALSTVMEDELMARGERAVVWGGFQDGRAYAKARHRWEELARTSTWCAVLADFSDGDGAEDNGSERSSTPGRPVLVGLPADSPMLREWCVVALAPRFAVLLSAWEVPTSRPGRRTYETVLSTRRSIVVSAGRALADIARRAGTPTPPDVVEMLGDADPRPETSVMDADRLWARAIEALVGREAGAVD